MVLLQLEKPVTILGTRERFVEKVVQVSHCTDHSCVSSR